MRSSCLLVVTAFALAAPHAVAETADVVLPHQGRLLDSADRPVEGPVRLSFRIFESHEPAPGQAETPLWTAEHAGVVVSQGLYSVLLGGTDLQRLPSSVFEGERWLEVSVEDIALKPRLRIGTVPRAVNAVRADRATNADHADLADRATSADRATKADRADEAARADSAALAELATDAERLAGRTLTDLDARYARVAEGGGLEVAGPLTATALAGDGAGLTNLDAAQLSGRLGPQVSYAGAPLADAQIASAAAWNAKVASDDPRLSDARDPKPGSAGYVWNGTAAQPGGFNLAGSGTLGTDLLVGGSLRLGAGGACATGTAGSLRYAAAARRVEFCDGSRWLPMNADFRSCQTILETGASAGNGTYRLASGTDVQCDMTTDGGGWTRITGAMINAHSWMTFDAVAKGAGRSPTGLWFNARFTTADTFVLDPLASADCANDITIRATVRLPFQFDQYRGTWKGSGSAAGSNHDDNDTSATWGARTGDCYGHLMFGTDTHVAKTPGTYGTNWNQNGATQTFTWPATRVLRTNELRWELEDQGGAEDVVFSNVEIWVR